jgi:hypothetical protein
MRIFLDTQQWTYLFKKEGYSEQDLGVVREQLINQVAAGRITVIGSLRLMQEVTGTAYAHQDLRQLLFSVVRHHWLNVVHDRYLAELRRGGILKEGAQYLPRQERRKLEAYSRKISRVVSLADETRAELKAFKDQEEQLRSEVLMRLKSKHGHRQRQIKQGTRQWLERNYVREWV